jgi:hypothetical protein
MPKKRTALKYFLCFFLGLSCSAVGLAQAPTGQAAAPTIVISASITRANGHAAGEGTQDTPFWLSVDLAEAASPSAMPAPATSGQYTLLRASLFHDDETPKRIEVVVWLDPRHFSLNSHRHGLLVPNAAQGILGHHDVFVLPSPGHADADTQTTPMRLYLRSKAPPNEISTVGVILLADDELIADLALPLEVISPQGKRSDAVVSSPLRPVSSPLRPEGQPGNRSDDGVLTIIELHPAKVQLTFAAAGSMRSWRVFAVDAHNKELELRDWPKYVGDEIVDVDLSMAASTFSGLLFPTDASCEGDCAGAASLFNAWARRAAAAEVPPTLTVQMLPFGEDRTFAPMVMPVGILPIAPAAVPPDPALQPEWLSADIAGSLLNASAGTTDVPSAKEDQGAAAGPLKDPADPQFTTNQNIGMVMDPVAAPAAGGGSSSPPDTGAGDEEATRYLAYKVIAHSPLHRYLVPVTGACAGAWLVLLPPDVPDPHGRGLDNARAEMHELLNTWKPGSSQPGLRYERSLSPLMETKEIDRAWLIVSHFNDKYGALEMPRAKGGMEGVTKDTLRRKLAPPGVAVLLACQTAVPATFLASLLSHGVSTLIATSALLPGEVAGQFATAFMGVLGEAGAAGIATADAFRESLKRLPHNSQQYVPRFVLAGDPNVRLCAPPLVR